MVRALGRVRGKVIGSIVVVGFDRRDWVIGPHRAKGSRAMGKSIVFAWSRSSMIVSP